MQQAGSMPPSGSSEAASSNACRPRVVVVSRLPWLLCDVGDGGRRRSSEPTTPQGENDGCAPMAMAWPQSTTPSPPSSPPPSTPPSPPNRCFICLESSPLSRRDAVRDGLCACKSLSAHMSCLASLVNSDESKGVRERLRCAICRQQYRVDYELVAGRMVGGGVFHPPQNAWEWLARRLTDEPRAAKALACAMATATLALAFAASLGLFVAALVYWSMHSSYAHEWLVVLLGLVFCLPCIRWLPVLVIALRERLRAQLQPAISESAVIRSVAEVDSQPWHIRSQGWHVRLRPPPRRFARAAERLPAYGVGGGESQGDRGS